ncbi:hypothetical protein P1X14_09425 [Sphingomonas sp. AOB5]|uniref:hypothetical protein n=1 Tax=Sphingomonas sp. AOB5 TaxID=3034017 RepID=UPI0023F7CF8D|nr:hypothetical protein [Sphingomonas sp. AOB5]MDF7775467.1 hypothetical protein [Sphingomonas sp. AOB5]
MIALALLLATGAQEAGIDWTALPALPYRAPPVVTQGMHDFAHREVRARKCPLPKVAGPSQTMSVELALLVDGSGEVRTVVPRAIDCPTVEQYAAGLTAGFARNNLLPRSGAAEQWFKTTVTFTWRK